MPVHSSDGDFPTAEDGERYLAPEVPVGWGRASREEEEFFFRGVRQRMILLTMPTLPFVFFGIDHTPTTRKIRLGLEEKRDVIFNATIGGG